VETTSLTGKIIEAIDTFACEPVHPAWAGELTTPIATSMAVLQLAGGRLLLVAPCEVELDPGNYPSLGLTISECDASARQWQAPDGKTYFMEPLAAAAVVLPFSVQSVAESDPLREGTLSEVALVSPDGSRLVFRHIMPPMTLGIDVAQPSQAPNNSSKPTPLRGAA
jgi:hypothetical protein